jgi:hypothetical protein
MTLFDAVLTALDKFEDWQGGAVVLYDVGTGEAYACPGALADAYCRADSVMRVWSIADWSDVDPAIRDGMTISLDELNNITLSVVTDLDQTLP